MEEYVPENETLKMSKGLHKRGEVSMSGPKLIMIWYVNNYIVLHTPNKHVIHK